VPVDFDRRSDDFPAEIVRFLFYELVQRGILSKERKAQGRRRDQNMSEALTDLRERWYSLVGYRR
jgi:hypothetical protein